MDVLKEIDRFMLSEEFAEEELNNKAQEDKDVAIIISAMKKANIDSTSDDRMEELLDSKKGALKFIDSDRVMDLLPLVDKKLSGK